MKRQMFRFRQLLRQRQTQFSTFVSQVRFPCIKTLISNNQTLSNSLLYGGLYTLAEVTQQTYRLTKGDQGSSLSKLDGASIQRYAVMGTACMGPMMAKWYQFIDKLYPGRARDVILKKLTLDQFAFTPLCVVVFFVGMAAMEGYRGREMFEELRQKGLKTFALDCCFWIPNTAFNFMFVPAGLRVVFVSVSSFIWLNALCWIKSWPVKHHNTPQTSTH